MKKLLAAILVLCSSVAFAQAPPSTGGYTFQGQGNLPAIITSLANPQLDNIPIGNGQNGYSLVSPSGDISLVPTTLGKFNVTGAHFGVQVCNTSSCNVVAAVVQCDATSGAVALRLPGASATGYLTWIEKIDDTNNLCTIDPAGTDLVNDATTVTLNTEGQGLLLDDAAVGTWQAGLFNIAGSTGATGFPLTATADANRYSIINLNGLVLTPILPPVATCTATCSGTCATTYTYQVFGEGDNNTYSNPRGVTCTNAASLSSSNFNTVSWILPAGATAGVDVYGRLGGSLGLVGNCGSPFPSYCTSTTFKDDGTPPVGVAPPTFGDSGMIQSTAVMGVPSWIGGGTNTASLANNTFVPAFGEINAALSTENLVSLPAPFAGIVVGMYCSTTAAPGTGNTVAFVFRDNTVSQMFACTIAGNTATTCHDTMSAHAAVIAAGDQIDTLFAVTGGSPSSLTGGCTYQVLN